LDIKTFQVKIPMLDYFDQIYIINLESRPDRLEEMSAEFHKIGIDIKHEKINMFKAIRPERFEDWPTQGAKGCYLSHLAVLKDAKQQGFERILILEDDVNFVQYFNFLFEETIHQLKAAQLNGTAWNIFYAGHRVSKQNQEKISHAFQMSQSFSKNLFKPDPNTEIFCLHLIALTKPTIAQMIDHLEDIKSKPMGDPNGGKMHVDGAYNWFRRLHPEIVTFIAFPELGYQRSSRTDIHTLKWFDILPIFKSAASAARKVKNNLFGKSGDFIS
jgi:GR25 family glycosyltransferase involved in LPS biosynthesis